MKNLAAIIDSKNNDLNDYPINYYSVDKRYFVKNIKEKVINWSSIHYLAR